MLFAYFLEAKTKSEWVCRTALLQPKIHQLTIQAHDLSITVRHLLRARLKTGE